MSMEMTWVVIGTVAFLMHLPLFSMIMGRD